MKILVPGHYTLFSGGIATVARGLIKALEEQERDDVQVIVSTPPPRRAALSQIATARSALARLRYEQVDLARQARRADSVHLLDARPIIASRTPFVMAVHDVSYLDHPEWISAGAARYKAAMLHAALMRRPAAIVFDSEFSKQRLLHHHRRLATRARLVVLAPASIRLRRAWPQSRAPSRTS